MTLTKSIILLGSILFANCSPLNIDCKNKIYTEIPSPDKKHILMRFSRDCGGGTSHESIQLSILKFGDALPNETGNLFICYGLASDSGLVIPTWLNDSVIIIDVNVDTSEIFKMASQMDEISIKYNLKNKKTFKP